MISTINLNLFIKTLCDFERAGDVSDWPVLLQNQQLWNAASLYYHPLDIAIYMCSDLCSMALGFFGSYNVSLVATTVYLLLD